MKTITFNTKWASIEIPSNEAFISLPFKNGSYWDIDTLEKLKEYIPENKNILEIGGHVGTSTVQYAKYINNDCKYWVFEPQKKIFDILQRNIIRNSLNSKVTCINGSIFCYSGVMNMHSKPLDGPNSNLPLSFQTIFNKSINYGGITVGIGGEQINCYKVDDLSYLTNIGFIHCDAQGSEPFCFYGAKDLVKRDKPVILFEDKDLGNGPILYRNVCNSYKQFKDEAFFDIKSYCMNNLNYSKCIHKYNNSDDTLLIP